MLNEYLAHEDDLRDDLADLRHQPLRIATLLAGTASYAWYLWIGNPGVRGANLIYAWIGVGLLLLGSIGGYLLRDRHLGIATHVLVWSISGATACAVLLFPYPSVVYLFILPITFASVLLSQRAFLLVAITASLSTLTIGLVRVEMPVLSTDGMLTPIDALITRSVVTDVALPVATITLVALTSWLSSHNLYTVLAWAWHGYERARQKERVARERQAGLRRALKALDEATHRLERTNYMLALARDQAEEARRLKQQFAQTISHELRTPLNLIVGFTELMAHSPEYYGSRLPPAYSRDVSIVYRNARHLQTLVNDVLDLGRIEAAQMSLLPEETDPAAMVHEAVNTARSLVEARGLTLHTEIEPDLSRLWVDPTRIRQVLFNLLNNAARFTEEGAVTVSVSQQGQELVFAVTDTGVGIAPVDIPVVFEEFRQADGSTRRRQGGAGLGLAISKRFVELHGGRIWVESQVGQGSTFYFSLPAGRTSLIDAQGDRSKVTMATRPMPIKGSEEPVLLAVTRSLSAAALLKRYVQGCRVMVVPNLAQARETAQQLMPQVVVIDRASEEFDPSELEELGHTWQLPHTQFIMSPLPGEETLRQRLAVDGYLVKPVSRRSVWDVLRRFGEDVDSILVVDDDQDFVLLLSRMLEDSPVRRYQVISAGNGSEGLAMMHHYQPDAVLLDLAMPGTDGFHFIQQARANPAWQHIPIVVVSAQDAIDDVDTMTGTMLFARTEGFLPGEVVRWIQNALDATVTSPPVPSARRAVSVP